MKLQRVLRLPAGPSSRQCRHCSKTIRIGDVVLVQRMPNNPYGDRDMIFHKACVEGLLKLPVPALSPDRVPPVRPTAHEEFIALRERMIAENSPYV